MILLVVLFIISITYVLFGLIGLIYGINNKYKEDDNKMFLGSSKFSIISGKENKINI